MPLKIVRDDIIRIECDAIVNSTNPDFVPTGGADAAIHRAAGEELAAYCKTLGELYVGEVKLTPAFLLPQKFIIHTRGPEWLGGGFGEVKLLASCYKKALELAKSEGCESIAFPLISSGTLGYPKDRVLIVATSVITEFLRENEMDIYLVVYDIDSYAASKKLFSRVDSYIDDNYVDMCAVRPNSVSMSSAMPMRHRRRTPDYSINEEQSDASITEGEGRLAHEEHREICYSKQPVFISSNIDDSFWKLDRGFADVLFDYIDQRGITDVEAYKRSNVSKKTFSKIKCNPDYRPSKLTAVSFAIGLRLNLEETSHLLSTAGLCLSHAFKFDVIIEYFIKTGNYRDIFEVNEVLFHNDMPLLGF